MIWYLIIWLGSSMNTVPMDSQEACSKAANYFYKSTTFAASSAYCVNSETGEVLKNGEKK